MNMLKIPLLAILITTMGNCNTKDKKPDSMAVAQDAGQNTVNIEKPSDQDLSQYSTAYFASGCFWCAEAIFESVKGVKEAVSGFAGGTEPNPTYEKVGRENTGYAESVEVYYDPDTISYTDLVKIFFGSHDPTTLNRQGPDVGTSYRSIAFYQNDKEKKIIEDQMAELKKENAFGGKPIVTEVTKLDKFYKASDYHQDYEMNHPDNPYIQNVSIPRIDRFKQKFPQYLKEEIH